LRDFRGGRDEALRRGADRGQSTLFPECLDDWIDEDNPVRVIDVCVDELNLGALDFGGVDAKVTRPSYHPSMLETVYLRLSKSGPVEPTA
jgi:transposase